MVRELDDARSAVCSQPHPLARPGAGCRELCCGCSGAAVEQGRCTSCRSSKCQPARLCRWWSSRQLRAVKRRVNCCWTEDVLARERWMRDGRRRLQQCCACSTGRRQAQSTPRRTMDAGALGPGGGPRVWRDWSPIRALRDAVGEDEGESNGSAGNRGCCALLAIQYGEDERSLKRARSSTIDSRLLADSEDGVTTAPGPISYRPEEGRAEAEALQGR